MSKVTYSVALAIRFMLDLTWHGDSHVRRECPALKPVVWCNFLFFRRVMPQAIRRIKRIEASGETVGYWVVEREINFYLRDRLIGVVTLRGMKMDRVPTRVEEIREAGLDVEDVLSAWAVCHVWYYRVFDGRKVNEWIETDVPFSGYSSGQI